MHHSGGTDVYCRLADRLSEKQLEFEWPIVAGQNVGTKDDTLGILGAKPATIACLAAQLPCITASTVDVSRKLSISAAFVQLHSALRTCGFNFSCAHLHVAQAHILS